MDQMKIGKFIAALRKEKGLTQEQLGEKLGVQQSHFSLGERQLYARCRNAVAAVKRIRCKY